MFWIADITIGRISEENRQRYDRAVREARTESFVQLFSRLGAGTRSLYRRYQAFQCLRRVRKESIRELSRLNDHQLDDIGLSRADITAIATGDWFEFEKRANSKCSVIEFRNQTKQINAGDHSDQSDDQWKRAA